MLDVFNDDAFSVVRLTARVNDLPYVAGQISRAGYFDSDGIDTLYVGIERRPEGLALVGMTPRGGPGETIAHDRDSMRLFPVPHFQRDDALFADEVQGVRRFGTEDQVETVLERLDRKVSRHFRDFDLTLEHQRVGAIKGIILDKKGQVYMNLFNEFGITEPAALNFELGTEATNVRAKARTLSNMVEDALDTPYSGIDAWVGRDFWAALIDHKSVRETFLNTAQAAELRGDDPDVFEFGNIRWMRYRTGVKGQAANGNTPFIAANEARFVVRGVPDLFITRFAPADYLETVNTMGLPRYAKTMTRRDDKGVDIQVQMNPISMCTRPEVLHRAVMSA